MSCLAIIRARARRTAAPIMDGGVSAQSVGDFWRDFGAITDMAHDNTLLQWAKFLARSKDIYRSFYWLSRKYKPLLSLIDKG